MTTAVKTHDKKIELHVRATSLFKHRGGKKKGGGRVARATQGNRKGVKKGQYASSGRTPSSIEKKRRDNEYPRKKTGIKGGYHPGSGEKTKKEKICGKEKGLGRTNITP